MKLLAILLLSIVLAASCVEITKSKAKRSARRRPNPRRGNNRGHLAVATFLGLPVRRVLRTANCQLASRAVLSFIKSRKGLWRRVVRLLHGLYLCANASEIKRYATGLRRLYTRSRKATKAQRIRAVRRVRRVHARHLRRVARLTRGKRNAVRRAVTRALRRSVRRLRRVAKRVRKAIRRATKSKRASRRRKALRRRRRTARRNNRRARRLLKRLRKSRKAVKRAVVTARGFWLARLIRVIVRYVGVSLGVKVNFVRA